MQACIKTKRSAAVTSRHREPFNTCSVKQLKWAPDLMIVGGGSLESGTGSLGQGAGSLTRGAGSRRDPAEFKPWDQHNWRIFTDIKFGKFRRTAPVLLMVVALGHYVMFIARTHTKQAL